MSICMAPFPSEDITLCVEQYSIFLRSMLCAGGFQSIFFVAGPVREGNQEHSEHELMTSAKVKGFQNNNHRLFASFAVLMIISHCHSDFKDQFHCPPPHPPPCHHIFINHSKSACARLDPKYSSCQDGFRFISLI